MKRVAAGPRDARTLSATSAYIGRISRRDLPLFPPSANMSIGEWIHFPYVST